MANNESTAPRQAALARLLKVETDARERTRQAQENSEHILAEAKVERQRLLDAARAQAETETKTTIEETRNTVATEIQRRDDAMQAQVAEMNRRAQAHLDAAVTWIVAWVTGAEH